MRSTLKIFAVLAAAALLLIGLWFYFQPGSSNSSATPFVVAPVEAPPPSPPAPAPAPPEPNPTTPVASTPSPAPIPPPEPSAPPEPSESESPVVFDQSSPGLNSVNDLGVVEFSDGEPVSFNLDGGLVANVTPTVLDDGSLQLKMTIENPNNPDGSTSVMASPTIIARSGMPVKIAISSTSLGGTVSVSLTPTLKGQ
ncbi:MAG: hypothetical protein ABSH19_02275 [Opitutales bacterium]|jgi:hypothetical protein